MASENNAEAPEQQPSSSLTLRDTIASTRNFLCRTINTARARSPFADDKLEAADNVIANGIHTGYQAIKGIAVHGHPAVILTVAGVVAAVPSLPFGPRAIIRNAGLAVGLATVMIYPDHLRTAITSSKSSSA